MTAPGRPATSSRFPASPALGCCPTAPARGGGCAHAPDLPCSSRCLRCVCRGGGSGGGGGACGCCSAAPAACARAGPSVASVGAVSAGAGAIGAGEAPSTAPYALMAFAIRGVHVALTLFAALPGAAVSGAPRAARSQFRQPPVGPLEHPPKRTFHGHGKFSLRACGRAFWHRWKKASTALVPRPGP
eukprot:4312340-Pleurochrysis_carterae.AAC.1